MTAVMLAALMFSTACAPPARGRDVAAVASQAPGTDAVLEGTVEVLIEDSNQGSRTLYFLTAGDMRVSLRFSRPPNLLSGAHIRVQGKWGANGELEVETFEVTTP